MHIINDPAYLRDAPKTHYQIELPPKTAWDDGLEWRLISYLAFNPRKLRCRPTSVKFAHVLEQVFSPITPAQVEFALGKGRGLLVYAQPYAPLLKAAVRQIDRLREAIGSGLLGAGQGVVNLPSSSLPFFFWKRDVIRFKHSERRAARKLCRQFGVPYDAEMAPWRAKARGPMFPSLSLADGPSWRWWTKYFNE